MQLNMIREITFVDLNDDDVLPVSKVLWAITPNHLKGKLKPILRDALLNGKDLDLPKELVQPLFEKMELFRDEVGVQRAMKMTPEDDLFARFWFCRTRLDMSEDKLLIPLAACADAGNKAALRIMIAHCIYAEDVEPDDKVKSAMRALETLGPKDGYDLLALAYYETENAEMYEKTVMEGAEAGNVECCYQAVRFCEKKKDYESAKRYFEIGRFSLQPDAWFEYALTFWREDYGRRDIEYCQDLLRRAAFAGSDEAAAHLGKSYLWGVMYAEGKKDIVKAKFFLEMAERLGHHDAGYFVGCICDGFYENEPEEFIDHMEAMRHWEALAKKNHPDSLMQMGCAYYNGDHGFDKNRSLAWMYYRQAARGESQLGAAYYADMIADEEAPGTKDLAVLLFIQAMSGYGKGDRNIARECFAKAYTSGKLFDKDEEWAKFISEFEVEYQGDLNKTVVWVHGRLFVARLKYVKDHPERDDGVNWAGLYE